MTGNLILTKLHRECRDGGRDCHVGAGYMAGRGVDALGIAKGHTFSLRRGIYYSAVCMSLCLHTLGVVCEVSPP